jgi:hypothetical protein
MRNMRNTQMDIEELKTEELAGIAELKNDTLASGLAIAMMTTYIDQHFLTASPKDQALMKRIIKNWSLPMKAVR